MFKCKQCGRVYAALPAACECGNNVPSLWEVTSLPGQQAAPPQYSQPEQPQYAQQPNAPQQQAYVPQQPSYAPQQQTYTPQAAPPAQPPKKKSKAPLIVGIVVGVLVLLAAAFFILKALNDNGTLSIPFFDTLFGTAANSADDDEDDKPADKKDGKKNGEKDKDKDEETKAAPTDAETTVGDREEETTDGGEETPVPGNYRIGLIGPLTGDAAIYGESVKNGAQLAVEEINAFAAANGKPGIELRWEDDAFDAARAVTAYNTLTAWGMQALVGPVTTVNAIEVASKANTDRVFCVTTASAEDVTDNNDVMYQVCYTDDAQGIAAADYIAGHFGGKKVGVIYQNDDVYGQDVAAAFRSELTAKGESVVYEGTFTYDTSYDFSVQLKAAQAAGAQVLFIPVYYTEAAVMLKQSADIDYHPVFFGTDALDGLLSLEGFDQSLAEGVFMMNEFNLDGSFALDFITHYKEKYGEHPNMFAALAYDAVNILYGMMHTSNVTADMTAQEVCAVLKDKISTFVYNGLTCKGATWNADGAVSKRPSAVVILNGQYVAP